MLAFRTVTYCTENEETPYCESAAGRPSDPALAFAHDLLVIARKLPTGESPPKKRGRPSRAALAEPVRSAGLSRQERRYRDRMLQKAQEAWDKATHGQGVVLVNGEPVEPLKGGHQP